MEKNNNVNKIEIVKQLEEASAESKKMFEKKSRKFMFLTTVLLLLALAITFVVLAHLFQNKMVFPGGEWTQKKFGREAIHVTNSATDRLVDLKTASGVSIVLRIKDGRDLLKKTKQTDNSKLADLEKTDKNDNPDKSEQIDQSTLEKERGNDHSGAVLFFYGNGTCLAWCEQLMDHFQRLGYLVGVADYAGYGASTGHPSEKGCYETADAVYEYFTDQLKIPPEDLVLIGHSLGSGVAADLASRTKAGKLILCSGFTSLPDVGEDLYPWLPVRLLLKYHFNTADKLPKVNASILFLHGDQDQIVPDKMSRKNYQIAQISGKNCRLVILHGKKHDILGQEDRTTWNAIDEFLK